METLHTTRMILRSFTNNDREDFFDYAKDPFVGPMAGWPPHGDIETTQKLIDVFNKEKEVWAIVDKKDRKVIGSVGLHGESLRDYPGARELGFALGRTYWGEGRMVEVCEKVLEYGFATLGLSIVQIAHFDFNSQSKRVIEKLGFVHEGVFRQGKIRYDGKMLDVWYYSMTKNEYLDRYGKK